MYTFQQLSEIENLLMNIQGGLQICKLDDNFTILYMNTEFCKLVGYTRKEIEELFKNKHTALITKHQVNRIKQFILKQHLISNIFEIEYQLKRKDGSLIWVFCKGKFFTNENGERCFHCVFFDITKSNSIKDELDKKTFEIDVLEKNLKVAILNCDVSIHHIVNYANDELFNLIGYTRKQFLKECNNSLGKIIYSDDCEKLNKSFNEQLKKERSNVNTYRIIKRDGTIIWVLERGTIVVNSDGKKEFHCVITNVTSEEVNKQLLIYKNEKLLLSEKRYEIAMENSKDIIFDYIIQTKEFVCTKSTMKNINPFYPVNKGIEGLEGIIKSGLIHPNSIKNLRDIFKKIDEGAPYVSTHITSIVNYSREVLLEVSLTNVFDENSKPIRAIGVVRNINEKRMLSSEKKYRKAMTADKLFTYELNITQDTIIEVNEQWKKSLENFEFKTASEIVDYLCENHIHPEFVDKVRNFFDRDRIISSYKSGKTQVSLQCRTRDIDNLYLWTELSMNIIRDDITMDIMIRLYTKSINEQKEKEIKSLEEKRFYEAMISTSVIVYEINLTKNTVIRGNNYYEKLQGMKYTNNYDEMVNIITNKSVHPDDINMARSIVNRKSVLEKYKNGDSEIYFEFRRVCDDNSYIWMSFDAHLFEDPNTSEIKGFCYVNNINEKKIKELELLYKAEHDALTGFYNKGTVEKYIEKYLLSDEGKLGKHAFFIFDVDNFKLINDTFGHVFGDVILSRITKKIKDLFRDVDILGRIGGDEFVVLMKNIPSSKTAMAKANEICNITREVFSKNGKEHDISISIGIAIYNQTTSTYKDLYGCSDTALYEAKQQGKNTYALYDKGMGLKTCDLKKIYELDSIEDRSFEKNMGEYIFRILYESTDINASINDVLGLIGKQCDASRIYVFEQSNFESNITCTFQWCNDGIEPRADNEINIPNDLVKNYVKNFDANGIYYLPNIDKVDNDLGNILIKDKVKSLLQFSILKNNEFVGFIGFDECNYARDLTKKEIINLRNIANIIGLFIIQMRALEISEMSKKSALSIANSVSDYVCVIDKEQYKLLFISDTLKKLVPSVNIGDTCYEAIYKSDIPCEDCPINSLTNIEEKHCTDIYFRNFNKWLKAQASLIDWIDGKNAYMVNTSDISKYIQR